MDVYVKPAKKGTVTGRKIVYLKDIAEVFSPEGKLDEIKDTIILKINKNEKHSCIVSIIDIIKAVNVTVPQANITNLGEMDIIVEYSPKKEKNSMFITYLKVTLISITVFFGAATAIMTFHNDTQINQIFDKYYYMIFGETVQDPYVLNIPYSIGVAFGIIVFFNHFSKIHITQDPTPIEVQMSTYEKETIESVVDFLGREKEIKEKKEE